MLNNKEQYLLQRMRQPGMGFGEKLRIVEICLPELEIVVCVKIIRALLECALEKLPSNEELYALCEVSDTSEILHDYLRGFFLQESVDPRVIEIAQKLESVISFRIVKNTRAKPHDIKLRQTIAEYLLRTRN